MTWIIEGAEIVGRFFWRMVAVFVIATSAMGWLLLSQPKVYEARTLLLFQLGPDYIFVPHRDASGVRAPDPGDLQAVVNAEMQILASRALKRDVIDRFGPAAVDPALPNDAEGREAAMVILSDATSVSLITGSYIVRVGLRHRDPVTAASLSAALIDTYFARRLEVFGGDDPQVLRREAASLASGLAATDAEIHALIGGRNLLSYQAERTFAIAEAQRLQTEIVDLDAAMADARRRIDQAGIEAGGRDLVVNAREVALNPVATRLIADAEARRAERRALTQTVGELHPSVVALTREIEALETALAEVSERVLVSERSTLDPLAAQAQAAALAARLEMAGASSRAYALRARLLEVEASLASFDAADGRLAVLVERRERERADLAAAESRLAEAVRRSTLPAGDRSNIRVIDPPEPPRESVGAPRSVLAVLALAFGAAAALVAGAAGYLSSGSAVVTGGMAAQVLGAPCLGEVRRRRRIEIGGLAVTT